MNLKSPPVSREYLLGQIQLHIQHKVSDLTVSPLSGDASNRSYYRLETASMQGKPGKSYILMVLADPEPFKQSEEKVSGAVATREIPFINIQKFLFAGGVPVPEIFYHDAEQGLIYLEDLGDLTFEKAVRAGTKGDWKKYYHQCSRFNNRSAYCSRHGWSS